MPLVFYNITGKAEGGRHHYWDQRAFLPPPEHDGEAAAKLLAPFLKAGRLGYLA